MPIKWISEADELPHVGETVLLCAPRQHTEFWDIRTACILIRHEGVTPVPVKAGSRWPRDYYWGARRGDETTMVTGNSYWARLDAIELPPGAEHRTERGQHFIAQPNDIWVGQESNS